MTDNHSAVTAAELETQLWKQDAEILSLREENYELRVGLEIAEGEAAALRRERDALRAENTRWAETVSNLQDISVRQAQDNAKKDAALRAARPFVSPLVGSWKTAPAVLAQIDAAITSASQEADDITAKTVSALQAEADKDLAGQEWDQITPASQEAPASPAAEPEGMKPTEDLRRVHQAYLDNQAASPSPGPAFDSDAEARRRLRDRQKAESRKHIAASPSPGLRDAVRHKKRGTTYDVIGEAEVQCAVMVEEGAMLTVYRCHGDGKLWARPTTEFRDGRFEPFSRPVSEREDGQ